MEPVADLRGQMAQLPELEAALQKERAQSAQQQQRINDMQKAVTRVQEREAALHAERQAATQLVQQMTAMEKAVSRSQELAQQFSQEQKRVEELTRRMAENVAIGSKTTEVQQLLDSVNASTPGLVDEVTPRLLPLTSLQAILQNLVTDGVSIGDIRSILQTLAARAGRSQDIDDLTETVRASLGRNIVDRLFEGASTLYVIGLAPDIENRLIAEMGEEGEAMVSPELVEALPLMAERAMSRQTAAAARRFCWSPPRCARRSRECCGARRCPCCRTRKYRPTSRCRSRP